MESRPDRYSHGHHESVLRSHRWRTAENSAAFLLTHLRSGQDLLDVGCGPGTITAELARLVEPGRTTGIDLSADVIATAQQAQDAQSRNLTFQVGDVYDLEFEDSSFDVVYAHQVLQHLSDPVGAAVEMRRVLRRDGVLAVRESDFGAFVWAPSDVRLTRWMELYHEITRVNRAQADAGRHLPAWIRRAGFTSLDVTSSNWTFHAPTDRAWWGQLWADRVRHSDFAHQGLEFGLTSIDELADIADAFISWADDDDGIFLVVHVEVIARR